jgi:hypothetical protein
MHCVISLPYLIRWFLHVSASMCHLQGASHVLVSYLKTETFMLFVILCMLVACVHWLLWFRDTDKQHKHFCFQVTHEDMRSSLKMAHGCRNM